MDDVFISNRISVIEEKIQTAGNIDVNVEQKQIIQMFSKITNGVKYNVRVSGLWFKGSVCPRHRKHPPDILVW